MAEPVDHADLAYEPSTAFRWTRRAFDLLESGGLTAQVIRAGALVTTVIEGPCPRCDGRLGDRQVHTALVGVNSGVRGAWTGRSDDGVSDWVAVDITCGCGRTHTGAPEGVTGCGASFRVELTVAPDTGSAA